MYGATFCKSEYESVCLFIWQHAELMESVGVQQLPDWPHQMAADAISTHSMFLDSWISHFRWKVYYSQGQTRKWRILISPSEAECSLLSYWLIFPAKSCLDCRRLLHYFYWYNEMFVQYLDYPHTALVSFYITLFSKHTETMLDYCPWSFCFRPVYHPSIQPSSNFIH